MLKLRPFIKSDSDTIVTWIGDESMFRKWSADRYDHYPILPEDITKQYSEAHEAGILYPFTAFDEDGICGHLIMRFLGEDRIRFGFIIVAPDRRGKGYGREMLRLALKYAFDILGAKDVSLGVFDNNPKARCCYESVGFTAAEKQKTEFLFHEEKWLNTEMVISADAYEKRMKETPGKCESCCENAAENGEVSETDDKNTQSLSTNDVENAAENGKASETDDKKTQSLSTNDVENASENGKASETDDKKTQSLSTSEVENASENGKASETGDKNTQSLSMNDVENASENGKASETDDKKTQSLSTSDVEKSGELREFARFMEIVRRLRAPGGCPWDREQTHRSLRDNLLEEAYEVAEAIDNDDMENICEEIGDCLLIICLQAVIGEENGEFDMEKAIKGVADKMIFRHPHVFGENPDGTKLSTDDVLNNWEQLKKQEKKEKTLEESLMRVPKALPANIRAMKIQKKASKYGLDFENYEQALTKVYEELKELEEAKNNNNSEEISDEFGDLLFSVINISRFLMLNAENSLTNAVNKFINRVVGVERLAHEEGRCLTDMSAREIDELWTKVKIFRRM